jgi:peptidoglycan/xylan/chitin deacetylase (PgdA/CDA1 family)
MTPRSDPQWGRREPAFFAENHSEVVDAMLKSHDRYSYSPITERTPFDWPDGKRLAVYVALNVEQFPFGEGMGVPVAPAQPEPDVVNFSWRDYGNRIGFWRILEMFEEFEIPLGMIINTEVFEHCPQIGAAILARGDEIIGHGRTNAERQGTMDEPEERALIEDATRKIDAFQGSPPSGWMSPWVSESVVTPDLVHEAGYRYLMDWGFDDQPVWLETRSGRILTVPYPRPTNDLPMLHGRSFTPAQYADILIDQFDEMRRQSESAPLVFGLSFHPYLIGHAFMLKHIRRAIEHIAAHRDVWLARPGDIANHAMNLPKGTLAGDG